MGRLVDAGMAQMIADTEMVPDDAGKVQWVLSHTPTVDAKPIRRGRWLYSSIQNAEYRICNQCGTAYKIRKEEGEFYFCPKCGSEMEK